MSPKNSNGNVSASISNHNSNINRIRRDNQQQQQHKNRQQMQNQAQNSNHIEVLNSHNQTGLASSSTAGRSPERAVAGDGNIADEATTSTDNNVEENAEEEPAISTTTAGGGGSSRNIRPEDVLWWICLFFTARCFDLPAVLIFSKKINRFFLQLAFLCPFLLILLTFFHPLARPIFGNWARRWLWAIQLAAGLLFLGTPLCFCLATWEQFGVWSLFISIVGIQSALALIAVL